MIQDERCMSLAEAATHLPTYNGKRVAIATLWRWGRKGVRGVRLEVRRIGRRLVTSLEALDRFSKTLTDIDLREEEQLPQVEPIRRAPAIETKRMAAIDRAKARLAAKGI